MRQSQQKPSAFLVCWNVYEASMANNVDPEQTAPIGAVCSGSMLFVSTLNSSVMLGNYLQRRLQQTTFSDAFFLGALRVNIPSHAVYIILFAELVWYLHLNSGNRMCRLGKQKSNKANLSNLYPQRRIILEKHRSQNINPIFQPLSSAWVSYRSKLNAY